MTAEAHEMTHELADIALARITVSRNVRSDLGDLDGLVASIRAVGVLQPVTVRPDWRRAGFYELLVGHRRREAARLAGLDSVPAIIRHDDLDDAQIAIEQLVENVHRHEMDALDEAAVFGRLVAEYGLTQEQVAERASYSQSHIAKRMSLLALPSAAQAEVRSRRLPLHDAYDLARLAHEPVRIARVLKAEPYARSARIQEEIAASKHDARVAQLRGTLEQAGVRMVGDDWSAAGCRRVTLDEWQTRHAPCLLLDPDAHETEPCHAVYLDERDVISVPVCTDPARHRRRGASKLKVAEKPAPATDPAGGENSRDDIAPRVEAAPVPPSAAAVEARALRDAARARREFIGNLLAEPDADQRLSAELVFDRYATIVDRSLARHVCDGIGLDPASDDPRDALASYVALIPGARNVVAFVRLLIEGEHHSDLAAAHYRTLVALGYQPTDIERDQFDTARAAGAGGTSRDLDVAAVDADPDPADGRNWLERAEGILAGCIDRFGPDQPDLRGYEDELDAGELVEGRAREIACALEELYDRLAHDPPPPVLGDAPAFGNLGRDLSRRDPSAPEFPMHESFLELSCQRIVADVALQRPTDPHIAEIREEIMRGIERDRAREILRELDEMRADESSTG